jgi:hypothetical protein
MKERQGGGVWGLLVDTRQATRQNMKEHTVKQQGGGNDNSTLG